VTVAAARHSKHLDRIADCEKGRFEIQRAPPALKQRAGDP